MKRKALFLILATVILVVAVLLVKPEYKWLIFLESNSAEGYAVALLNGDTPKTPNWAIDLTTITENGFVIFAEHNAEKIYAYSPNGIPKKENIIWSKLWDFWYVGVIQ